MGTIRGIDFKGEAAAKSQYCTSQANTMNLKLDPTGIY